MREKRAGGVNKNAVVIVLIITVLVAAAAITLGIGSAFGWFKRTVDTPPDNMTGGTFKVRTSAWFDDGTSNITELNIAESIEVDLRNESAANFVGKLRVKTVVTSDIVFALRLNIVNFWHQDDTVPRLNPIPFTVAGNVLDNSRADSHYYSCDVAGYTRDDYDRGVFTDFFLQPCADKEFMFVTGVDISQMADYESNVTLRLLLRSEAVQANRITSFWTKMPLPSA